MSPNLPLDPAKVRALFPAFAEPALENLAYFDNAGGSYMSRPVLERLERFLHQSKVQPYGAAGPSAAAGEAMDLAFRRMAEMLNVTPDWIHLGPSTSANTFVLGRAFEEWLQPGDAVVVTNQDHEANSGVWRRLAGRGIEVREWRIDPATGHLDRADLAPLLDERTRLVTFPHCSNVVGEINPVPEIAALAHAVGAVVLVDGVSYAPHGPPDLATLGADIYLFSPYKVYGPHQGLMAVRPDLAANLPNQGHFFNADRPHYRLTPAGPDHAQVAACAGIADYLEALAGLAGGAPGDSPFRRAHAAMRAQEIALLTPLLDFLADRNDVRLIGPRQAEHRAPTVAVGLAEPGSAVAERLAKHGIMAGGSHFYSWRTLQGLGIDPERGVLRLSFVHYTSPEEIDRLIKALDAELH